MDLIADILLVSGALGVAFYCFVLSRRLTRFTDLEQGVGGAVAVLSAQVDDLNKALDRTRAAAEVSGDTLRELTDRADGVARKLELHVAAMHDLPAADAAGDATPPAGKATSAPRATVAETAPDDTPDGVDIQPIFSARARAAPTLSVAEAPVPEPDPVPVAAKPATGAAPVPSFFARRPAVGAAR